MCVVGRASAHHTRTALSVCAKNALSECEDGKCNRRYTASELCLLAALMSSHDLPLLPAPRRTGSIHDPRPNPRPGHMSPLLNCFVRLSTRLAAGPPLYSLSAQQRPRPIVTAPGALPDHEVLAPPPADASSAVHMCELDVAHPIERATM